MNPSPSPIPVTVVAPPPEWWQIVAALSPFAVLIGAIVAGIIGFNQIKQKREADNRAEWWKRTQWALDAVYSGEIKRATMGMKVLTVLAESKLAGSGELDVLEAAWEVPLSEAEKGRQAEKVAPRPAGGWTTATGSVQLYSHSGEEAPGYMPLRETPAKADGVDDEPDARDNKVHDEPQPTGGGP